MNDVLVDHVYNELFFFALLEHCNSSQDRIDALTRVALRHLTHAVDTWAAIRRAIVRQADVDTDNDASRALWFLTDALLKHAPHVFVPTMSPRLVELAIQYMPWNVVRWHSTAAPQPNKEATLSSSSGNNSTSDRKVILDDSTSHENVLYWCEELIQSWEHVLPRAIWSALERHRCLCRSEAHLNDVLFTASLLNRHQRNTNSSSNNKTSHSNDVDRAGAAAGAATPSSLSLPEELRELQEEWTALRYRCQAMVDRQQQAQLRRCEADGAKEGRRRGGAVGGGGSGEMESEADALARRWERVITTHHTSGQLAQPAAGEGAQRMTAAGVPAAHAAMRGGDGGHASDRARDDKEDEAMEDEEEEDDYAPEFVPGAVPRALPSLGLPARRRRREAHCRPREDDF